MELPLERFHFAVVVVVRNALYCHIIASVETYAASAQTENDSAQTENDSAQTENA